MTIRAEDSPNVRYGLAELALGRKPSGRVVLEGVLTWAEYAYRRANWDKARQKIGLDAQFPDEAGSWMFPVEWRLRSIELSRRLAGRTWLHGRMVLGDGRTYAQLVGQHPTKGIDGRPVTLTGKRAMGVDPAEGGDRTCWTIVDELGVLFQESFQTPNTNVVPGKTVALMREWGVPDSRVCFDRGGGGKEHVDRLRAAGLANIRTVAFGETIGPDVKKGSVKAGYAERLEVREDKYVYANRRVEMHHTLRLLMDAGDPLDVSAQHRGFAIPAALDRLHQQMSVCPLAYDDNGRMVLPDKAEMYPEGSPDELDSLVLAVHALVHQPARLQAGAGV